MLVTLPSYILRETVKIFLIATAAVTGVVFVSFSVRLLHQHLNIVQFRSAIPYVILFSLPYAVPCSLLIATVLSFGRFASDNEYLAARAHGVRPLHLIAPALLLALAISLMSFSLNGWILPQAQGKIRALSNTALQPFLDRLGRTQPDLELAQYRIYVDHRDPKQANGWVQVAVARFADEMLKEVYWAQHGSYDFDEVKKIATITLDDVQVIRAGTPEEQQAGNVQWPMVKQMILPIDLTLQSRAVNINELTWSKVVGIYKRDGKLLQNVPRLADPREDRNRLLRDRMNMQNEKDRSNAKLNAMITQQAEMRTSLQTCRDQVEALGRDMKSAESDMAEAAADSDRCSRDIQRYEAELKDEQDPDNRKDIESHRASARALLATAQQKSAGAKNKYNSCAAQLPDARGRLTQVEMTLADLNVRTDALSSDIERKDPELAKLKRDYENARDQEDYLEAASQIHYRLSQSVAAFAFVLIGIPLGLLLNRGSAVIAFGASLAIVLVLYYPLYCIGRVFSDSTVIPPGTSLWIAPLVCVLLGIGLFIAAFRR